MRGTGLFFSGYCVAVERVVLSCFIVAPQSMGYGFEASVS